MVWDPPPRVLKALGPCQRFSSVKAVQLGSLARWVHRHAARAPPARSPSGAWRRAAAAQRASSLEVRELPCAPTAAWARSPLPARRRAAAVWRASLQALQARPRAQTAALGGSAPQACPSAASAARASSLRPRARRPRPHVCYATKAHFQQVAPPSARCVRREASWGRRARRAV